MIHFTDGSSYRVWDEEDRVSGCALYSSGRDDSQVRICLRGIIDVRQVEAVEIDGVRYVIVTW